MALKRSLDYVTINSNERLDTLPLELLEDIVDQLDLQSIGRLSRVNSVLYENITHRLHRVWKRHYISLLSILSLLEPPAVSDEQDEFPKSLFPRSNRLSSASPPQSLSPPSPQSMLLANVPKISAMQLLDDPPLPPPENSIVAGYQTYFISKPTSSVSKESKEVQDTSAIQFKKCWHQANCSLKLPSAEWKALCHDLIINLVHKPSSSKSFSTPTPTSGVVESNWRMFAFQVGKRLVRLTNGMVTGSVISEDSSSDESPPGSNQSSPSSSYSSLLSESPSTSPVSSPPSSFSDLTEGYKNTLVPQATLSAKSPFSFIFLVDSLSTASDEGRLSSDYLLNGFYITSCVVEDNDTKQEFECIPKTPSVEVPPVWPSFFSSFEISEDVKSENRRRGARQRSTSRIPLSSYVTGIFAEKLLCGGAQTMSLQPSANFKRRGDRWNPKTLSVRFWYTISSGDSSFDPPPLVLTAANSDAPSSELLTDGVAPKFTRTVCRRQIQAFYDDQWKQRVEITPGLKVACAVRASIDLGGREIAFGLNFE
eukprot:TRINITY_DN116_c0_g3_i1.p1 TRINITY_DN116_c0_g3~~TRINITY_DN116_c0_g3_i1.p1  ORF type:complete len:538 (+),score=91.66 TRINITY_DN116_c0_g3_i1:591-2204(+)